MTAAFDTLKYAKQLENAGVPKDQAEIHAEALRGVVEEQIMARFDWVDEHLSGISTDIIRLQGQFNGLDDRIKGKFNSLDERMEGKFNGLEERTKGRFSLLQWMLAFNLAISSALLLMQFR